jgi:hypothetical protein
MRRFCTTMLIAGSALASLAASAHAQSVNIRFGAAATTPSPSYAAAGLPGVWNSFPATDSSLYPLVSLAGTAIPAQYYQSGSQSILYYNNPLTSGDDANLMNSMYIDTNNPASDGCFWVTNLIPGSYEVTIYAMTPNDPTLMTRTRVDSGTPGPVMVGGTWPGHHQQYVTYSRFTVTTTGTIGFHDGLAGAPIQSGMNGAQLRFLGACPTPSITTQPVTASSCGGHSASFSVAATSTSTMVYQWQIETAPGVWQGMGNDPGPLPCGNGAFAYATPINSPNVSIGVHPCPGVNRYQIRCLISNQCGTTTSNEATLVLNSADFDGDGSIGTDADIEAFFECLSGTCCPNCGSADFNGDRSVGTDADIESFFRVLAGGPC